MDGMEVLQKVGGFDLAAMAGAFLGGAIYHVPVVIDGVIAAAAAGSCWKNCTGSDGLYAGSPCIGGTSVYLAA